MAAKKPDSVMRDQKHTYVVWSKLKKIMIFGVTNFGVVMTSLTLTMYYFLIPYRGFNIFQFILLNQSMLQIREYISFLTAIL